MAKNKWYTKVPHSLVLLFSIIIIVAILTYVIPAGEFERVVVNNKTRVVPNSYKQLQSTPVSFLDIFRAIPIGFKKAASIVFVVLAGGIMFNIINASHAIENAVGTLVNKLGGKSKNLIIIIITLFYGLLGVVVGYEQNIALIPLAAVLSLAIGGDLILAAGMSVGALTIGFGLSPINPYTVGVGQEIAELPLFSGAGLRSILCFIGITLMTIYNLNYFKKITANKEKSLGKGLNENGISLSKNIKDYTLSYKDIIVLLVFVFGLAIMLWGIFNPKLKWSIDEISAIFLIIAVAVGIVSKINVNKFSEYALEGISKVAPGAFMVGFAASIKVLLDMGNISDTISNEMAQALHGLPHFFSAIGMSISQSFINLLIPSGSGQALATLPIMIPLGEVLGLTRQTTILAFQVGDGVTNLVNPTLGGLIAMLSMCRVPLNRWLRFIVPVAILLLIICWIILVIATAINYR